MTGAKRNFEVDVLRGFAIVLMVLFHFGYDLTVFGWADYNTGKDPLWKAFRAVVVSGFLLAMGMSFYLSYYRKFVFKKWLKGLAKLVAVALLLSVATYFIYPNAWIYFGIIHFIALCFVLCLGFVRFPHFSAMLGFFIIVGWAAGWLHLHDLWQWSRVHLGIPERSVDLVKFFPWFALVLFGIFLMHYRLFGLTLRTNSVTQKLATFGKHSLLIYLVHQPLLFAGLWLVSLVL